MLFKSPLRIVSFCLTILVIATGCEEDTKKALPGSTGKAGEVVLVMDNRNWEGELGTYIKNTLAKEYKGLPQPEPIFNLVHIPKSSFKGLFLTHRNILIFSIVDGKGEQVENKKNKWATSQLVVNVRAATAEKCLEMLKKSPSQLETLFTVVERRRLRQKFKSIQNAGIAAKLSEKFGFSLTTPTDYVIAEEKDDFLWFRKETPEISQGIFVYSFERGDTDLEDLSARLAMRDTIAKQHIPGPLDGSYMSTMREYPASTHLLDFKGKKVIETRGLWKVIGDFMGGPFISLSLLSEDEKRIICIDGYVYAPKYDKRNYLRQVEAVLYSLQINN